MSRNKPSQGGTTRSRGTMNGSRARWAAHDAATPVAQAIADALNPDKAHEPLPLTNNLWLTSDEFASTHTRAERRAAARGKRPRRFGPPQSAVLFDAQGRIATNRYKTWTVEQVAAVGNAGLRYLAWLADREQCPPDRRAAIRKALILAARR